MRKNFKQEQNYLIGVDGGATQTMAALANLKGKVLKIGKAGSSSPRNVGIKKAVDNIGKAIFEVIKGFDFKRGVGPSSLRKRRGGNIVSTFIALPSIAEEYKFKIKEIKKELAKYEKVRPIFKGKITIGSDQLAAFRSGVDNKEGVLLIAGTGSVARGWKEKKEAKAGGWGWLADEGSAFWVGQKVFRAILKDLDGRGEKTLLTKLSLKKFKSKNIKGLLRKIYSENPTEIIPMFSILADKASELPAGPVSSASPARRRAGLAGSRKRDKVALKIMKEAGQELALSAKKVIKELGFQKKSFPLVLVGSMFKSKIVLAELKKEIKKFAPKTKFILVRQKPVVGAIKLAKEQV